jgi:hypothetical protein
MTSTLYLKSNAQLYLAPGAEIRIGKGGYADAPIVAKATKNAGIRGRGIIYAGGSNQFTPQLTTLNNKNLQLSDIMVLGSPSTFLRFAQDTESGVHNMKILAAGPELSDGIDTDGVFNFIIENSFVLSTDDNFAIGSGTQTMDYGRPINTNGLIIRNNVQLQLISGRAFNVTTHIPWQYIKNVLYENNTIVTAQWGVTLLPSDGQTEFSGITIRNNRFEEIVSSIARLLSMDFQIWGSCSNGYLSNESGAIHNILFDNNTIDNIPPNGIEVTGRDATPLRNINNVQFNNLKIGGKIVTNAADAHAAINGYAANVRFTTAASPLPLPRALPANPNIKDPSTFPNNCNIPTKQPLADPQFTLPDIFPAEQSNSTSPPTPIPTPNPRPAPAPIPVAIPNITRVSPGSGPASGGKVTITGTGFDRLTGLWINIPNAVSINFTVNSPTQITATIPASNQPGSFHIHCVATNLYCVENATDTFTYTGASSSPVPVQKTGDINGDGRINAIDLSFVISYDNTSTATADLNHDGKVGAGDLAIVLAHWTW